MTEPELPIQTCNPNPCGPYSVCELNGPRVVCSCQKGYFGRPPNCHPECLLNSECAPNLACIKQKCQDPCIGVCGINAVCNAVGHQAICSCPPGYSGYPFESCNKIPGTILGYMYLANTQPINYWNHTQMLLRQHHVPRLPVFHPHAAQMLSARLWTVKKCALVCQDLQATRLYVDLSA